jgi:hypothetical protein
MSSEERGSGRRLGAGALVMGRRYQAGSRWSSKTNRASVAGSWPARRSTGPAAASSAATWLRDTALWTSVSVPPSAMPRRTSTGFGRSTAPAISASPKATYGSPTRTRATRPRFRVLRGPGEAHQPRAAARCQVCSCGSAATSVDEARTRCSSSVQSMWTGSNLARGSGSTSRGGGVIPFALASASNRFHSAASASGLGSAAGRRCRPRTRVSQSGARRDTSAIVVHPRAGRQNRAVSYPAGRRHRRSRTPPSTGR